MKLKKILATLVAVMMLASLAACSSNNTTPAEETEKNTKDTIVTEQPTETPSGKVDENGREDDHGIADPTSEVKPTDEVTPTEEPTPEMTQAPAYDPEEAETPLTEYNSECLRYTDASLIFNIKTPQLGDRGYRFVTRITSSTGSNILDSGFDLDGFADSTGFPIRTVETETDPVTMYPIPLDLDQIVIRSYLQSGNTYDTVHPDSCIVFVREDEDFDMNALYEQAKQEKGDDYTIDQMIRDEYANIVCFDISSASTPADVEKAEASFDPNRVFAGTGTYKTYFYVYYPDTQEWHRDTRYDYLRIDVANYADYGLTIEF